MEKLVSHDKTKIVYLRYRDHVLFRNTDPGQLSPSVRETVGWVAKESGEALYIVWETPVKPMQHERSNPAASGLVVLKTEIVERKRLG